MFAGTSQAELIVDGLYQLSNHPDGGAAPPLYGLRLDGLGGGSSIYTFDFNYSDADRSSAMFLDLQTQVDGNRTIRIFGDLYGGLNSGSAYADPTGGRVGWWTVDFTYRENGRNSGDGGNFDDVLAGYDPTVGQGEQTSNNGALSWNDPNNAEGFAGNGEFELVEYPPTRDYTFRLGDETDGHRGFDGLSGWGWMNHSGLGSPPNYTHQAASDWLFTAELRPVPAPSAFLLGLVGLVSVRVARRKERRNTNA